MSKQILLKVLKGFMKVHKCDDKSSFEITNNMITMKVEQRVNSPYPKNRFEIVGQLDLIIRNALYGRVLQLVVAFGF